MQVATTVSRSIVRGIIIDDADRVLLMKMSFPWFAEPVWIVPGGGLEDGETAADGLRRELHFDLTVFAKAPLQEAMHVQQQCAKVQRFGLLLTRMPERQQLARHQ